MQGAPAAIGRYQILAELGQGAMGIVYLAMDPTLKRKVAIKVMKERPSAHSNVMERFRREAETSSRLNHPNVITVYDVGEDPEIGPFMAMEFVDGQSLASLIERNALSQEAGFQVLTQIMYGLMAAGAAEVIHRDVKPENLLVGKDGRVKLMDFGIARGEGDRLTTTGMVVGTPSYTAPELLLGKDASFSTDLYAFVVTAFELLTGGALPYSGDSLGVTLYRIVHEPPTMPEDLEPALAAIFNKGLNKDPAQRYPSLGDFMSALAEVLHLPPPVMPVVGTMPGHGAPSGVTAARPSQEDLRTSAVPARRTPNPSREPMPSGEMGRQLAPPPQSLMKHKSPGEQTPKPPPSAPPPAIIGARPSVAPKAPAEVDLADRLKAFVIGIVLLGAAIQGYIFWSNSQERLLSVRTTPTGAQVWVDGQDLQKTTPCEITVKAKAKRMQLSRTDYLPEVIELAQESGSISKPLRLQPGYFRVITEPSDAKVFLNGELIGNSPIWSRELIHKSMSLHVEKNGYEPWDKQISEDQPPPGTIVLQFKKH